MEFYFNREVKCGRNVSEKRKRGVKLGEKHRVHETAQR